MKAVTTFLLGAVLGVAGLYLYHKYGGKEVDTSYGLDLNIVDGHRVELKEGSGVIEAFENQLQKIDPGGQSGSWVNIKPAADKPNEVDGPWPDGTFKPVSNPTGPDGSIHNTQRVAAKNMTDLQSILDFFAARGAGMTPSTTVPSSSASTEPPTTTPSPSGSP